MLFYLLKIINLSFCHCFILIYPNTRCLKDAHHLSISNYRYMGSSIKKKYTVAEFDDGTYLVPTSWIGVDGNTSKWPNGFTQKRIKEAIKECRMPSDDWETLHVKVLKQTSDYEKGMQKLKDIENLSLSEIPDTEPQNSEAVPLASRNAKKKTATVTRPIPPKQSMVATTSKNLPESDICSDTSTDTEIEAYQNPTFDTLPTAPTNPVENVPIYDAEEFQKTVIRLLASLKTGQDEIKQKLEDHIYNCFSSNVRNTTGTGYVRRLVKKPFLTSMAEMEKFESLLLIEEEKVIFFKELRKIGGSSVQQEIANIVKALMSPQILAEYVLHGQSKAKKKFKDTQTYKLVTEVIQSKTQADEATIDGYVGTLLRNAPAQAKPQKA